MTVARMFTQREFTLQVIGNETTQYLKLPTLCADMQIPIRNFDETPVTKIRRHNGTEKTQCFPIDTECTAPGSHTVWRYAD